MFSFVLAIFVLRSPSRSESAPTGPTGCVVAASENGVVLQLGERPGSLSAAAAAAQRQLGEQLRSGVGARATAG